MQLNWSLPFERHYSLLSSQHAAVQSPIPSAPSHSLENQVLPPESCSLCAAAGTGHVWETVKTHVILRECLLQELNLDLE